MPCVAGFLRERASLIASATPGPEAARTLSDFSDRAVSALAEAALSTLSSPWTVLALGGWGAGRLLPRSDLDMLVVADAPPAELRAALRDVLYPLWDAGLTVGHQVRTRRDHERACRSDLETLTATLTGRVLCGDRVLGERLLAEVASGARKRSRALARELAQRQRPGSPYLLEPDLKVGAGGQRDLDEMTWLGSVLTGRPAGDPATLVAAGMVDAAEMEPLAGAGSLVTAARWEVHRLSPRAASTLTLELGAEGRVDTERVQQALADIHHILLRVRGRVSGRHTACDPHGVQPHPAALDGPALFALLDAGEPSLPALEEAAWAGMIDDLAPAFGELMTVRRPALTHQYTVGAHCLRTAALVSTLAVSRPEAARAAARVKDVRPLQVAAILHDVGKSQRAPGHAVRGAAAVETLGPRFGLSREQTHAAALLVREHLLLAETASGEDIHDEDVLLRASSRIPGPADLDALYLLTMADSLATGPGAWTAWHAALIGELSDRLRSALSDEVSGAGIVGHAEAVRAEALSRIRDLPDAAPLAAFVQRASLRYLAAVPADEVVRHATLAAAVSAAGLQDAFRTAVSPGPAPETWRVSVAARDRSGLFAAICGALSLSGLDIMGADAYDAHEGVAVDVFTVRSDTLATVDTATWSAFERHLSGALIDPGGLAARLAERQRHYPARTRVRTRVETRDSGVYATAIEVRAADRVGLLHDLALAFAQSGLRIAWARALTKDGVARDVFHVTDELGEPVDDPGVLGHVAMRIRERA
ncbi:MAG TPA: HD domain-containing protein [Coriobacteriia bacterium]